MQNYNKSAMKWDFSHVLVTVLLCLIVGAQAQAQLTSEETGTVDCEKAQSAYERADNDTALVFLKRCQQHLPHYLPAQTLVGKIQAAQGAYFQAIETFDAVRKRGADPELFAHEWALSLLAAEKYTVLRNFDGFQHFSDSKKAHWLLARAEACLAINDVACARQSYEWRGQLSQDIEQTLGLVGIAIETRNWQEAERILKEAVTENSTDIRLWLAWSKVSQNQGNRERAFEHIEHALALSPDNPLVLRVLADLYLANDDTPLANQIVDRILRDSPNDPYALLVSNSLQKDPQRQGQLQTIQARITQLTSTLESPSNELLFLQGLMAYQDGNFEQALSQFLHLYKARAYFPQIIVLLAKTHLQLGQRADSLAIMEAQQNVLLAEAPDAFALMVELYIEQGTIFKALSRLQALQQAHPARLDGKLLEVKLQAARGNLQQATDTLISLQKAYPDEVEVQTVYAVIMARTGQVQKALGALEHLLSLTPQDAALWNFKGALYLTLRQPDKAYQAIVRALELEPELVSARLNMIGLDYQRGEQDLAIGHAKELVAEYPENTAAGQLLGGLLAANGQITAALMEYQRLLEYDNSLINVLEMQTSILLDKHDLVGATKSISRLIELDVNSSSNLLRRAQMYIAEGDATRANNDLNKVLLYINDDPGKLVARANISLQNDNSRLAIQSLNRARQLLPNDPMIAVKLTEVYLNTGDSDEAANVLSSMPPETQISAEFWMLKGRLAEQQGELKLAKQHYYTVLQSDPDFDLAFAKLYSLLQYNIGIDEFENHLKAAVQRNESQYFKRNLLAQFYYYQQRYKDAAPHYEYIYQHTPSKRGAFARRLAQTYFHFNAEEAINYTHIAFQESPEDAYSQSLYGWAFAMQGEPEKALKWLREAYTLDSSNLDTSYFLAYTLHQLGLREEAIKLVKPLLNIESGFGYAEEAKVLARALKLI